MIESEIIETVCKSYVSPLSLNDAERLMLQGLIDSGIGVDEAMEKVYRAKKTGGMYMLLSETIRNYTIQYDIIVLSDKYGKVIKAYRNEKADNKTLGLSKEDCQEREPSGDETGETEGTEGGPRE